MFFVQQHFWQGDLGLTRPTFSHNNFPKQTDFSRCRVKPFLFYLGGVARDKKFSEQALNVGYFDD
jgi:hypothetical protein